MSGYYDYGPTLDIDRHIVLIGLISEETRTIGYRASALLGLPVTDIERVIEHHSGRSVWDLIWSEGEERYRQLEERETKSALAARPLGLISLGDGALISPELRDHVLAEADLVAIDMDLANCYWRLQNTERSTSDYWHPLHGGPLENLAQVRPYFDRRRPALDAAPYRLELGGSSLERAVDELVELISRRMARRTPTPVG